MIPAWKIRREGARFAAQIRDLPRSLAALPDRLAEPALRFAYARNGRARCRFTQGAARPGGKLAIFLIYQPQGLPPSLLSTCAYLADHGYAILAVSNTPLAERDRESLLPLVWQILERPNFGKDFGGYKDGISVVQAHLDAGGTPVESVILLNDSVWFPLHRDQDTLERLAGCEVQIAGLLMNVRTTPGLHTKAGEKHVESYFYRIRADAFHHPAFTAFWRDYRMTNDKAKIIKRGEIGFTRAMDAAGLTLGALITNLDFARVLQQQDGGFLRKTLQYGVYLDADLAAERERLLSTFGAEGWREDALAHIQALMARRGFHGYGYATDQLFGTRALKKQRQPFFRAQRRAYLAGVEAGDIRAPERGLLNEIREASDVSPLEITA